MTNALDITGLSKTYNNGFSALKGIDLSVAPGDFFALLGPNGAGKSTTIGIISSLINKSGGDVRVFGTSIDDDFPAVKNHIGIVPQEFNFNQFEKVQNIVITQAGYYGIPESIARERAQKYLTLLGLWDKRDTVSRALSGGMKRRLMIARALVHEPKLLILDEPTAGVDIELRRSMWEFLRGINDQGTTIILTTHYLEEAEYLCKNIAIIDKGCIAHNSSMQALLSQLQQETFVLDVKHDLPASVESSEFRVEAIDRRQLEVTLDKSIALNTVFAALSEQDIEVMSLRNKANRLEELFVGLVAPSNATLA
ncbi:MAG: ABC transporter ATP-binding protein, partial [Pseudomonadota bacterium]